jgi:hypothetical protein
MKDAYQRRALLLHLGDVLEVINRLLADGHRRVPDLLAADKGLERLTWLSQLSPGMTVEECVRRAAGAFSSWPGALLEPELNREQLALTVQRSLFAGNPEGWRAYVAVLQQEVAWFGTGLPPLESTRQEQDVTGGANQPDSPDSGAAYEADRGDIERDDGAGMRGSRESVESDSGLYPSWPWKSDA